MMRQKLILVFLAFQAFFLVGYKSAIAQSITTIAGDGSNSYGGDGGLATAASINFPGSVCRDFYNNVYITDRTNNRIRKIDDSGIITTIAGTGIAGFSGDGGLATAAKINSPIGISVDDQGTIYFSDNGNERIRKISSTGIISTIAGTGTAGFTGDGGPATSARLSDPWGVYLDQSNNLYIADRLNNRIRKIDLSTNTIVTFAGTGTTGYSGDGGLATSADLNRPISICMDNIGNLYLADENNNRVRKVLAANGNIILIAGNGTAGFSGDGGNATAASMDKPCGVYADIAGNVYISDRMNQRIRKVNTSGTISTIAGTGVIGFSGDGGPGTSARLNYPRDLFSDGSGNIYVADASNNRVRKITFCNFPTIPTVSSSPSSAVCSGTPVTLSITSGNLNQALNWEWYSGSCGGTHIGSGTSIVISPTVTTTYYVRGEGNCVTPYACKGIMVNVNQSPTQPVSISGATAVCFGSSQTYSISAVSGATDYTWTLPSGWTGSSTSASITATAGNSGGTISVTANNGCGSSTAQTLGVSVNTLPIQPGSISGTTPVCQGTSQTYSISTVSGASDYTWTLPSGWTGSSVSTSISTTVGSSGGTISVTANNSCGSSPVQNLSIAVDPLPAASGSITGVTSVCRDETNVSYNISPVTDATGYNWSVPSGASITTGANTTAIMVDFGSTSGNVLVVPTNACGNGTSATKTITINIPGAAGSITGPASVCNGQTGVTYSIAAVTSATDYNWTLPAGATIASGANTRSIVVDFGSTSGNVSVTPGNVCENGTQNSKTVTIANAADNAGSITGSVMECAGTTGISYSIAAVTNATGYAWTVPTDATITAGANTPSITISFGSTSGNVTVLPTSSCGNGGSSSQAVTVNPLPVASISSPSTTICAGSNITLTANLIVGATYEWFKNSTSIGTAVVDDNTLIVTQAGTYYVKINNGCTSSSNSIVILENTLPGNAGTITGAATFCSGTESVSYSIPSVTGATDYLWEISPVNKGSIATGQGTRTATMNFLDQNVTIKVTPRNTCGSGNFSSKAVSVDNAFPCNLDILFGAYPTNTCQGTVVTFYNYSSNQPAGTTMQWTFGNGASPATATGNGPHDVTYNSTGNKSVTVEYIDNFGFAVNSSTKNNYIKINGSIGTAGSISGNTSVCSSVTGVSFNIASVAGATGYNWSVPSGATITSGNNTNAIIVNFGTTGGNVTVAPTNSCGNGTASTLSVSVNQNAGAAGTITGTSSLCDGAVGVNYHIAAVTGATGYAWTVPSGSTITSGDGTTNIVITFGGTAGNVSVTPTSSCGNGTVSILPVSIHTGTCIPPSSQIITGSSTVTSGQTTTYSVNPAPSGSTYSWTLPPGSTIISSNSDSSSVTVLIGPTSGSVTVTETNAAGGIINTLPITVTPATGLTSSNVDHTIYEMYPNPFDEIAIIKVNTVITTFMKIKLTNVNGVQIFSSDEYYTNQEINIGKDLRPGIYFLEISYLDKNQVLKFIKI